MQRAGASSVAFGRRIKGRKKLTLVQQAGDAQLTRRHHQSRRLRHRCRSQAERDGEFLQEGSVSR